MALELSHLHEVGVATYPHGVIARSPVPCKAPADAPVASKKEKVGEASAKAAPADAAGSKKEKAGKEKEKAGKDKGKAAAPVQPAGPPPAEKTAAELAKMSKEERTQYHAARRAATTAAKASGSQDTAGNASAPAQLTKAQRRAIQESQRKKKEDKVTASKEGDELFEELKLQGLTEDQAREVMKELQSGQAIGEDDEDDEEEVEDLLGSVRRWMAEQEPGPIPEDAMADFNMKVRFQGHVDTTPPDHVGCIMKLLVDEALGKCDLTAAKVQPGAIAKAVGPLLERWAPLLRGLYSKIPDVLEAITVVVRTIGESVAATGAPAAGQDSAVVGCLMAVRELEDLVEDEDLLVGCKSVEPRSHVLEKFIEFLEDALEEDDEDDEGDD